jgi:hypothetical protein
MSGKPKIKDAPDGSKTIDFSDRPIEIDGTSVTRLVMREPTVGDQLAVSSMKNPAEREIALIANLCELSPEIISGFTMRQYNRLQDAYTDFTD